MAYIFIPMITFQSVAKSSFRAVQGTNPAYFSLLGALTRIWLFLQLVAILDDMCEL